MTTSISTPPTKHRTSPRLHTRPHDIPRPTAAELKAGALRHGQFNEILFSLSAKVLRRGAKISPLLHQRKFPPSAKLEYQHHLTSPNKIYYTWTPREFSAYWKASYDDIFLSDEEIINTGEGLICEIEESVRVNHSFLCVSLSFYAPYPAYVRKAYLLDGTLKETQQDPLPSRKYLEFACQT